MDLSYSKADSIYNAFEKRLTNAYRKELVYNLIKNVLLISFSILILGFILIILEAIFHFRSSIRTPLFWIFILTSTTTLTYFIVSYILKRIDFIKSLNILKYAKRVGGYFTNIKDSVANSLSLYNNN